MCSEHGNNPAQDQRSARAPGGQSQAIRVTSVHISIYVQIRTAVCFLLFCFFLSKSLSHPHLNTFVSNTQPSQSTWTWYLLGTANHHKHTPSPQHQTRTKHTKILKGRMEEHHVFSMSHFTPQIHSCYSPLPTDVDSHSTTESPLDSPQHWGPAPLSCN